MPLFLLPYLCMQIALATMASAYAAEPARDVIE